MDMFLAQVALGLMASFFLGIALVIEEIVRRRFKLRRRLRKHGVRVRGEAVEHRVPVAGAVSKALVKYQAQNGESFLGWIIVGRADVNAAELDVLYDPAKPGRSMGAAFAHERPVWALRSLAVLALSAAPGIVMMSLAVDLG